MTTVYTPGDGSLWIQPDGPNSDPVMLECHGIEDVVKSFGAVERAYRYAPNAVNKYKMVSRVQGPPEGQTTTILTDLKSTADYLEKQEGKCPFPVYVLKHDCKKGTFSDWQTAFVLPASSIQQATLSNLLALEPAAGDTSQQAWEIEYADVLRIRKLGVGQKATGSVLEGAKIVACGDITCWGCGDASDSCDTLVLVTDAGPAAVADIYYSVDGGETWTATAADPFAIVEDIPAIVCFRTGPDTWRWLAGRGVEAAPANPPEIAYSDDAGATWTNVDLGAVAGDYFIWNQSIFALDHTHVWAGTEAGDIWFSSDAGVTWTEQVTANVNAIYAIKFLNQNIGLIGGAANTILYTANGGDTWTALTGPAAEAANIVASVHLIDENHFWIGYSSGNLYYSNNAGATWTERVLDSFLPVGTPLDSINHVTFIDEQVGWVAGEYGANLAGVLRTFDGGANWQLFALGTTGGAGAIKGAAYVTVCDYNKAFVITDEIGATGPGVFELSQ